MNSKFLFQSPMLIPALRRSLFCCTNIRQPSIWRSCVPTARQQSNLVMAPNGKTNSLTDLNLKDPELLGSSSYVNGSFTSGTRENFDVVNPYTNISIITLKGITDAELDIALDTSEQKFKKWRNVPVRDRSQMLREFHSQILQNKEDLAKIITLENGKPLAESLAEVDYGASYVDWFVNSAQLGLGTAVTEIDAHTMSIARREPVGVCLAVTPWNFPLAMLARKVAPALAVGCSVIAKPSEVTPLSAIALGVLAVRAGAPPGLFNVIASSESERVCNRILAHRAVRMLTFTGSTRVGRALSTAAANRLQRTAMELGGLAPFIVFNDSDVDAAVDGLMRNKFRNCGQSCVSSNRVLVQDGEFYDKFVQLLEKRMNEELVVGNGASPSVNIGPMINAKAIERMKYQIQDAVSNGAKLLLGGNNDELSQQSKNLFPPTLLIDVPDKADIAQNETFGPVIAIQRFSTEEEVINRANATEMGLASYIYSNDTGTVMRVSRNLEAGMVGANTIGISECRTVFGGVKQSGSGREGSMFGLEDYTELKYVLMRGNVSM